VNTFDFGPSFQISEYIGREEKPFTYRQASHDMDSLIGLILWGRDRRWDDQARQWTTCGLSSRFWEFIWMNVFKWSCCCLPGTLSFFFLKLCYRASSKGGVTSQGFKAKSQAADPKSHVINNYIPTSSL